MKTTTNRSIELNDVIQNLHNKIFGLTCYLPFDKVISLEIKIISNVYHIYINGKEMFVKDHLYITCEKYDGETHLQFFDHIFDFNTILFTQDEKLVFATGYRVYISDIQVSDYSKYTSNENEVFDLDNQSKSDQPENEVVLI